MKILWVSNSPTAPTGYGIQTALFLPKLKELGHDMMCTAFWGVQGQPIRYEDILVLPGGRTAYGNDIIGADATFHKADAVITLMDAWVLEKGVTRGFNWYPWMPIDHDPIPPGVTDAISTCRRPIAYSKFGVDKLREAGFNPLYVPHGVDTQIYHRMDQADARKKFDVPEDIFLVGMVAANKGWPSRKAFTENLKAFKLLHDKYPDTLFYIHTDFTGQIGINLEHLIHLIGIPEEAIARPPLFLHTRNMLDMQYLNYVYNACDVVTNVTRGEGFGVPIIEAQATGTPVIVGNWTAMPELVPDGLGYKVDLFTHHYSQESWQFIPDHEEIFFYMEEEYLTRTKVANGHLIREWIEQEYSVDVVTEKYWKPVLAEIEDEVLGGNTDVIINPS